MPFVVHLRCDSSGLYILVLGDTHFSVLGLVVVVLISNDVSEYRRANNG